MKHRTDRSWSIAAWSWVGRASLTFMISRRRLSHQLYRGSSEAMCGPALTAVKQEISFEYPLPADQEHLTYGLRQCRLRQDGAPFSASWRPAYMARSSPHHRGRHAGFMASVCGVLTDAGACQRRVTRPSTRRRGCSSRGPWLGLGWGRSSGRRVDGGFPRCPSGRELD